MIQERLAALRSLMKKYSIDAYMVPTDDFHCSEYVGDYFKCRQFITGFTGSAGTAVITRDQAGLWTDGRYFIQAEKQLEGSGITLFKIGEEGVPDIEEYLEQTLVSGQCLGFDGRTVTAQTGERLEQKLSKKGISLSFQRDLIGEIWEDRPALSCAPAWILEEKYAGRSRSEKLAAVREAMEKKNADYFLLSSLDDISWLLNIRGNDVACTPVVLAYLAMTPKETLLFTQKKAFSGELEETLYKDGITLRPYNDIYAYASSIKPDSIVLLHSGSSNYALKKSLPKAAVLIDEPNPTELPKAAKNLTEADNIRKAHLKDGVAVTKFIYWLKQNIGKTEITELSAAAKLEEFRQQQKNYIEPSFSPIMACGAHGAIVHYSATEESDIPLASKGFLLADTGGHYLEGTTDITRTIVLGETTREEKEFFTRVLRGNLNLAAAKFLYGSCGMTLDYLARGPLWEIGEDYKHGTGHGVGYLLNVHEGPNNFFYKPAPGRRYTAFEEGMVTSDEPGYYAEGKFGIRHENLMLCKKTEKTSAGQFMEFETLTLVPFDLDAVLPEQMTAKERKLLNAYHRTVYEKLSPFLEQNEKEWLKNATREI